MADYKIGQILTSTEDVEIEKALSGEKVKIPKGNKIIIGADKLAHHIKNGFIQPLTEGATVEGYDTTGIAEYLYTHLRNYYPLDEMLDENDIDRLDFEDEIECALDEIL